MSSERGLAYVELPHASGRGFEGWKERHATGAVVREAHGPNREVVRQLLEFLEGKRERFELELDLRATAFQTQVYERVAAIPYGETRAYGEIARELDQPAAVRAVGAANGANPIPLVIPCHRVVAADGKLQGYAGGLPLKAWLLALESRRPSPGRLL
ncbi:MAG: methylated-DNA--[protein]-cysteine S-methyltransferase [Proteobacteria bacterium]|nr:methylated-DNA--[protein]-cysteine S-methyltransferase [Pseudomonadota bacterium]